ncbi:MAG: hypothetical protein M1825_003274 [Sarcosagium campestre]|nr:MAG: hypothetical protein M1825_003274 [Sarcosagium campestre]
MAKSAVEIPLDVHPHSLLGYVHRKFNLENVFVVDTWPISDVPTLVINDPVAAKQVAQTNSLPKDPIVKKFVSHLVGQDSMLTADGEAWKKSRSLFNAGFSIGHLMTLTSPIVDDVLTFCDKLEGYAQNDELFILEEATTRMTIDIIGRVVLDVHLDAQNTENDLMTAFRTSVLWTPKASEFNPLMNLNPLRPLIAWWCEKRMDRYVEKVLEDRLASQPKSSTSKGRRKPAIDLALEEYLAQNEEGRAFATDRYFKRQVLDNMKTFIFAGHDTSSSTICYVYHLLNLHPHCLTAVSDEHDQVFGKNPHDAADMIKADPHLLNQLPYTLAVIKEVLRLFPVADTARRGQKGINVTHNGRTIPTEGFLVMINNYGMSRRPDIYPRPEEFHPDRFLPNRPASSPQTFDVPADAWRPFEKGPRACIGQELALLEIKIAMVLTLRLYDISAEYAEYDKLHPPGKAVKVFDGYRAYQTLIASAKPIDGLELDREIVKLKPADLAIKLLSRSAKGHVTCLD